MAVNLCTHSLRSCVVTISPSRYILLLGAGDPKEEVAKAARGHLYAAVNRLRQQAEGGHRARRSVRQAGRGRVLNGSEVGIFSKN